MLVATWAGHYDSNGSLSAFSNWYLQYNSGQTNYLGNLDYQCVEFANRFADKLYHTGFWPHIQVAADMWSHYPTGWLVLVMVMQDTRSGAILSYTNQRRGMGGRVMFP